MISPVVITGSRMAVENETLLLKLEEAKVLLDECIRAVRHELPGQVSILPTASITNEDQLDFTMPDRAFMKRQTSLSGAGKFTALLAFLAKGNPESQIALSAIKERWDSMAGMLGIKFNRKFTSDAREADWVDTKKPGLYYLRPNWRKALTAKTR